MEYILIVLLLVCSAFFSGTEIAYTSLNKLKAKRDTEHLTTLQKLVGFIYNHYDYALSTVLVGNNLVNIGATSVATVLAVKLASGMGGRISDDGASTLVTIIMTVLILIFGEITPKMVARRCSESFSKMAAWPLMILMILFFPVVYLTSCIVKLFSLMWKKKEQITITEEEFETLLDTAEDEGVIDESETDLLQSALTFTELDAADILTPRIDVVGFELNDSMEHVLEVIAESQFSRFPVYERTVDHVVGILYAKHLLKELMDNKDLKLADLILEPVYIPKTMRLPDIMDEFRAHQTHMVIVADEYGGIMGIVTMEDVLEQLVGEIWDENDDIVNDWQELNAHRFECSGDMHLTEFFDNLDLDDEELESDCATVGGWAVENIGTMPSPFDSFDYERFTIMVKQVDDNHRITRLLILKHGWKSDEDGD